MPLGHGDTQAHFADTPDLTLGEGAVAADLPATPHPRLEEHWKLGALGSESEGVIPSCLVWLRTARTCLKRRALGLALRETIIPVSCVLGDLYVPGLRAVAVTVGHTPA